jgi:sugar phosphate permease
MDSKAALYPSFRWVVLAVAWLAMVGVGWIVFLTPALAYDLVPDLGLTPAQLTLIFTAPFLMGVFITIPGGSLGDRYGIRAVVGAALALAGLSTIARAWVSSYGGMLVLAGVFGIGLGAATPNLPKLVSVWFPQREAGLASGIWMTGLMVGIGVGLLTGTYFDGWRSAFLYPGIVLTALSLLWFLFGRSAPQGTPRVQTTSFAASIKVGLRSKNVWLTSLSAFLLNGAYLGLSGSLPEALTSIHGITPKEAGAITSLLTFAGIPGAVLLPMISDKMGIRIPFLCAGVIVGAACFFFAWLLAPGAATYVLAAFGGFVYFGVTPLLMTSLIAYREIGQENVGGAAGVAMAANNAGGFLIPLLAITPVMAARTASAYNSGFMTSALLLCAGGLIVVGLTETGSKVKVGGRGRPAEAAE